MAHHNMSEGGVMESRNIFIDTTLNAGSERQLEGIQTSLDLPRTAFTTVHPMKLRLTMKQFLTRKFWNDCNSTNKVGYFVARGPVVGTPDEIKLQAYPIYLEEGDYEDYCRGLRPTDLRLALQIAINTMLTDLESGNLFYRLNDGTQIHRFPANDRAATFPAVPAQPALQVQVLWDAVAKGWEINFCNGTPNNAYPQPATNLTMWDSTHGLPISGGTVNYQPLCGFWFPNIKDVNATSLASAWGGTNTFQYSGLFADNLLRDQYQVWSDTYKFFGAHCARNGEPTIINSQYGAFVNQNVPAGMWWNQVKITAGGATTLGVVTHRSFCKPQLDTLDAIYLRLSLPNTAYATVSNQQDNDAVPLTLTNSDILARIPIPEKEQCSGSTGGAYGSDGVGDPPSSSRFFVGDEQRVGCFRDRIVWEDKSDIFSLTLGDTSIGNLKLSLTDSKGRLLLPPEWFRRWIYTADGITTIQPQNLQQNAATMGNANWKGVIKYEVIHHNQIDIPLTKEVRQQNSEQQIRGGAFSNVEMGILANQGGNLLQ